jgi:hypothetical protein
VKSNGYYPNILNKLLNCFLLIEINIIFGHGVKVKVETRNKGKTVGNFRAVNLLVDFRTSKT